MKIIKSDYSLSVFDTHINCVADNSITVTIPFLSSSQEYTIKNSGTGTVTLSATRGYTIDGSQSQSITPGMSLTIVSSSCGNWIII